MSSTKRLDRLAHYGAIVSMVVIYLLPFQALLVTWLGSNTGHLDVWRIWKEIILFVLFITTLFIALQTPKFNQWFKSSNLPKLIVAYLSLCLILGVWALWTSRVNPPALIYGLFVDLRFLGFFMITLVIGIRSKLMDKSWWRLLIIPGILVITFGLFQLALPRDFLRHFGYGPTTIPAFQTVDQKLGYRRIQSTMRGANPLGAYLVLIITGLLALKTRRKLTRYLILVAGLVVLFFSYSRAAYLGLLISAGFYLGYKHRVFLKAYLKQIVISGIILVGVIGFATAALSSSSAFDNVFFHTDTSSRSANSSNSTRFQALRLAGEDVLKHPLGQGPGTAGPASTRNDHPPRIAENYFLQVGQELGWLGLGLFIAIYAMVAKLLWQNRKDERALVLLASLIGLTVINLVSHAWADDTLGLLWWGLAGVVLSGAILPTKRKRHG